MLRPRARSVKVAFYGRLVNVIAATRIAPPPRSARAQAERVAPVVSTSSTRSTLRGASPRNANVWRAADPLGAAPAELTTAVTA